VQDSTKLALYKARSEVDVMLAIEDQDECRFLGLQPQYIAALPKESGLLAEMTLQSAQLAAQFQLGRAHKRFKQIRKLCRVNKDTTAEARQRSAKSLAPLEGRAFARDTLRELYSNVDDALLRIGTVSSDIEAFTQQGATIRDYVRRNLARYRVEWRVLLPHQVMPLAKCSPDCHQVAEQAVRAHKSFARKYLEAQAMLPGDQVPLTCGPYCTAIETGRQKVVAEGRDVLNVDRSIAKMKICLRALSLPRGVPFTVQWVLHPSADPLHDVPKEYTVYGTAGRWMDDKYWT
jgi:hypothetical protein